MKEQDKIIAIGGITLIFVLAIMALILLIKKENVEHVFYEPQVVEYIDREEAPDGNAQFVTSTNESNIIAEANEAKKEKADLTANNRSYKYEAAILKEIRTDDNQMAEIFNYWDQYHLEAIADLIRLERVRKLTDSLVGTNEFYYYGEVNAQGKPEGKGLAIYADNAYYFGGWKNGLREGTGMWLQIFPNKEGVLGNYVGVKEHQYNGEWKADLPNGNGQEHYEYNTKKIDSDCIISNAIGQFKNGYYHNEIYLMTIDNQGQQYDWYATANMGVFDMVEDKAGYMDKHPYWRKGNNNDHSTDEYDDGYFWMLEKDNKNWGIFGLMK